MEESKPNNNQSHPTRSNNNEKICTTCIGWKAVYFSVPTPHWKKCWTCKGTGIEPNTIKQ